MADYTYYEILDVPPTATAQEIKTAYQRAVRVAHPDVGGTAAMFGLVRAAYETLSDPDERAAYDDDLQRSALRDEQAERSQQPRTADGDPFGPNTSNGFPRRNSYGGSFAPEPEPEWGIEVEWPTSARANEAVFDDQNTWGLPVHDEPASPSQPRPVNQPWMSGRALALRDRYAFWTASRSGLRGLITLGAVALALYVVFAVLLFGNPQVIRPDAATSDAFQWAFVDGPFLRIIVIVYSVALAGALFGAGTYVLAGHALGFVGLVAWIVAYWDLARAGERLAFTGFAILWIIYSLLLFAIPLTLSTRRAMQGNG